MDILKTFGPLIGSVAPTIATALLGPVGGLAVKAISTALFGHENGTQDDIMTALANPTADQLSALKKIDNDFKVQMKSLDIDLNASRQAIVIWPVRCRSAPKSRLPAILAIDHCRVLAAIIAMRVMGFGLAWIGNDQRSCCFCLDHWHVMDVVMAFYFGLQAAASKKTTDAYDGGARKMKDNFEQCLALGP
jgi:hypothetical protein